MKKFRIFEKLFVFNFWWDVDDIFLALLHFLFSAELWINYISFITGFISGAYYFVTISFAGRDTRLFRTDC